MFANVRRQHGYHHHLHPHQHHQPLSVCRGCGFTTRHAALLDRHRRHCPRSSDPETRSVDSGTVSGSTTTTTVAAQRRVSLPAPSVCRNYKCAKCSFVTNRAKLFLYHQNCIHGENINVYGCDHCEYASRHKNKVLRHKRLVHKVASALNQTPARTLILADNNLPSPILSSTPQQQQQQQQQLTMSLPSDLKVQSTPGGHDKPVDLSASEEISLDAASAEDADNNNLPIAGSGSTILQSSTSVLNFSKIATEETPSKPETETVGEVDVGGGLFDREKTYDSMILTGDAAAAEVGSTEALAEAATKLLSSYGAGSAGGSPPSVPMLRCRYCRYTNRHKWKMASHVRASHSAGRPVYRCPECPRFSTDSRVEWSAHRSRHTGKVMFECPECAYATTMKRNYERHLERHRAGGPRRCGLCSYSSTGEGAIQRHMAEYHPPSPNRPLPPRMTDSPLPLNGALDDGVAPHNKLSLTSRPLDISCGDSSVGDASRASCEPLSLLMNMKQDPLCDRNFAGVETGSSKQRALSSSSSLPFDTSDMSSPNDVKLLSAIDAAGMTGQTSKSAWLNLTNEGAMTLSSLTSKTAKLPIDALQLINSGGDGLSPSAVGRCVCPLCPLSYKRPADLNRHMKQKHETTLKEFVLRNRLGPVTAEGASQIAWSRTSSASPSSILPALGVPSRSSVVSPADDGLSSSSSSSTIEIPLNLSLKDRDAKMTQSLYTGATSVNEVVNLSLNGANASPSCEANIGSESLCEQSEPLDLSSLGNSEIGKPPLMVPVAVSEPVVASPPSLVRSPQLSSCHHSEAAISVSRPVRATIGGVQIVRTASGYPCGHCSYVSKRASDLRRHQLVHSTSSKRYRCPHCPVDRSYKLQFDLGRHLARVHGNLTTSSGPAGSTATSRRHVSVVVGGGKMTSSVRRPTVADIGDSRNSTKGYDTSAWPASSGTAKNHLACPYCQYVGKSLAELEKHARLHSGEKPHRCPFCSFSTIWKSDMKVHLQKVHREDVARTGDFDDLLDRICRNVPVTVATSITENSHTKMEVADVTGSSSLAVVDHNMNVATVDGGIVPGTIISAKSGLHGGGRTEYRKLHQSPAESNLVDRPLGRCPLCPFQCQTPSEMSSHLEMHEKKSVAAPLLPPSKLFICVRCSLRFASRSDARNHVVLEHSEIPDPDRVIQEKEDTQLVAAAVTPTILSTVSSTIADQWSKEKTKTLKTEKTSAAADRKSPKSPTAIGVCGTAGDIKGDDVKKLVEQYANVVTEMPCGNENDSPATSVPAINQLCRYATTSLSSTPTEVNLSARELAAAADDTLTSGAKSSAPSTACPAGGPSKIPSATSSAAGGRFRPYKCSQCGKRSNWRWDLKKHIRSSRHPHADVVVLSDREARESFHEIADQINQKRSGMTLHHHGDAGNRTVSSGSHASSSERHSFVCSMCGFRSGSKAELVRHTLSAHPSSDTSSTAEGDFSTVAPSTVPNESASPSGTGTKASTLTTSPEERALYTVDRQKLKRLHCSACPYRSNFRSDVGRHIRHKHPNAGARIEVMSSSEAAASLADYLDTWARKKFVLSPVKTQRQTDSPTVATRGTEDPARLNGSGCENGPAACRTTPVASVGNFIGCSTSGYAHGIGDEQDMEVEDETLPWKCAACDFTDPGKQAVVEHWQKWHCGGLVQVDGEKSSSSSSATGSTHPEPTTTKRGPIDGVLGSKSSSSPVGRSSPMSRKRASPASYVRHGRSKALQCDICPYRTNKLLLLTIHQTYHRPQSNNSHKCPHCPYYVCAPRLLHQHIRIHSGVDNGSPRPSPLQTQRIDDSSSVEDSIAAEDHVLPSLSSSSAAVAPAPGARTLYPCASCPYVGHNRNDYIYHRQFHRPRPSAPFKCERCPYWVGQRRLLTQHRRVHAQAYRTRYPTETASLSSSKVGTTSNTDLDNGNCGETKTNGVNAESLNTVAGTTLSPTAEKRAQDGVDRAFKMADAVGEDGEARPLNVVAGQKDGKPGNGANAATSTAVRARRVVKRTIWRCDRCPYATAKRSQLETHRQLHGSGQRYACERCDYSVSGVHLLLQHVRLHDTGNVAAASTTTDTSRLGDAQPPSPTMTSASPQPPPQPYNSNGGGGDEKIQEQLSKTAVAGFDKVSASSTSGSRPLYRCDKCPYANARRDHLVCHARFHSGAGPLVCPHCDYSISKVHLLTQHIRVHTQQGAATGSCVRVSPSLELHSTTTTEPATKPALLVPIADAGPTVVGAASSPARRSGGYVESSSSSSSSSVDKSHFMRLLDLVAI